MLKPKTNPFAPAVIRYPCAARGCPMSGAIFSNGIKGICLYHYEGYAPDWPRITQVLNDWHCVTEEINAARRAQVDPATRLNSTAMKNEFAKAWGVLQPLAPNWSEQLQPLPDQTYAQWGRHLEKFMTEILKVKRKAL